jgi:hypothetical protein
VSSARISGRREHHGEIVHENSWPAIITPSVSDQLRALLTRLNRTRPTARAWPARHPNVGARGTLAAGIDWLKLSQGLAP